MKKGEGFTVETTYRLSGLLREKERGPARVHLREEMQYDLGRRVLAGMEAAKVANCVLFTSEETELMERYPNQALPDRDEEIRKRATVVPLEGLIPYLLDLVHRDNARDPKFERRETLAVHAIVLMFRGPMLDYLRRKKEWTREERMLSGALGGAQFA